MDRLSSLPDEILCHVLSFLTTKQAALTSVLSKRWRNLLAFVPDLEFDDSYFVYPEEGKREREGILESFMDFVDRVLALQGDSPIERFYLKCKAGVDPDRVDRWICNVVRRGVSVLSLSLSFGDDYMLPPEVFVSKTITALKVKGDFVLDWSDLGISLPRLSNLFIRAVLFCVDQFEMLFPACPVLSEINLHYIEWKNSKVILSSASLKELFVNSVGCAESVNLNPKSVSFDAPRLVFLWYSDFVAEDYPKVNLPNLVDARIDLKLTEDHFNLARVPNVDMLAEDGQDDVFLQFANVRKLIDGIKNVEKLFLSAHTVEVLSLCCESMPVFKNLKSLHIRSTENRGWQAMPVLLKNCPHLETIVMEGLLHFVTDKCGDACDCISREEKGRSLTSCRVKKLVIKWFRGTRRELAMIKHFLYSFPCLEEMQVYVEENDPTEFEVRGVFEIVVEMIKLYNRQSRCEVRLLVPPPLYEKWKWTRQ